MPSWRLAEVSAGELACLRDRPEDTVALFACVTGAVTRWRPDGELVITTVTLVVSAGAGTSGGSGTVPQIPAGGGTGGGDTGGGGWSGGTDGGGGTGGG